MLNISGQKAINTPDEPPIVNERECSKKHALSFAEGSIQQGRSPFDARSVLSVRERERREERQVCEPEGGEMATMPGKPFRESQGTLLAAFFNIP